MSDFSILIQQWYRLNKRDLPWRGSNSSYKIWISEVILQQTQVIQGLNYYNRFVVAFPTVQDLANADESEVLKLWQGLGYYSRARNMHFASKQVINDFNGMFPSTYKDLLSLKGVGEYTASAVASIVHNLPHAVVDGNVFRVLSRCFLVHTPINSTSGKKEFQMIADKLLDHNNPGDHNQALMEIGALICKPKNPNCENCPLQTKCLAYSKQTMLNFPVKEKKLKIKKRYLNYIVVTNHTHLIIKKREKKDIWQGLYDFRLLETDSQKTTIHPDYRLDSELKHILSHQHLIASFWVYEVKEIQLEPGEICISIDELHDYPLPQLLIKYLAVSDYFNR